MGRGPLLLAAIFALAACAQEHATISAPPPGISYRFQGDNIADANQRADAYCQQYGRHARLQTIQPSGSDKIAVYACS
jgi:uncharacterized lipoprotein YajG